MRQRIVVMRTHYWDAHVQRLFNRLKGDLGADRVYCIYDVTNVDPSTLVPQLESGDMVPWSASLDLSLSVASSTIVIITEQDCRNINAMHAVGKDGEVGSKYRGEAHNVAMYRALRNRDDWDYLWVLEYDVHCHGSWRKPLDACDAIDADFMAKGSDADCGIRTGSNSPDWCWWSDRYGPEVSVLPTTDLFGCFYPITRYSRAFLDVLDDDIGRNSGFCEVYIPTLCVHSGLSYVAMPAGVFGTFRFFDAMNPDDFADKPQDDLLYHPVKS
jgi:hypothetical protein